MKKRHSFGSGRETNFSAVDVTAELAKEYKKEADEKPEDAMTKNKAFTTHLKALQQQFEIEQRLKGRTYEVAKSTVEALLRDKAALLKKVDAPAAKVGPQGMPQGFPPGLGMPGMPPGGPPPRTRGSRHPTDRRPQPGWPVNVP